MTPHEVVFLLDVDNTLLDNDRVAADLRHHLRGSGREGTRLRDRQVGLNLHRQVALHDGDG